MPLIFWCRGIKIHRIFYAVWSISIHKGNWNPSLVPKRLSDSSFSFSFLQYFQNKRHLSQGHLQSALCDEHEIMWLVGLFGFNATLTAKIIWLSVTHMCFLAFSHQYSHNFSFKSHQLLFSHAPAEVRGKNTSERKFATSGGDYLVKYN